MSLQVSLSKRQQQILRATIRHYIATAEPVGSKALATEYDLSVSPATIRSCMGVLEKAGFLYQPHTSAGRIPSDSGYRLYVDQLITPSDALGRKLSICSQIGKIQALRSYCGMRRKSFRLSVGTLR
jgi:heat-inducible transcriptional repressor